MSPTEAAEGIENAQKVRIIRLHNGSLIAAKVTAEEDDMLFLQDPCFLNLHQDETGALHTIMEPFIPLSYVKTIDTAIHNSHVMALWEASEGYANYYNLTVAKFTLALLTSRNLSVETVPIPQTIVTPSSEETSEANTNVVMVDFKTRKKSTKEKNLVNIYKESEVIPDDDGPDVA